MACALAAAPVLAGCSPAPRPAPAVAAPPPADDLIGNRASYLAVADTTVTVSRSGAGITMRDHRALRRDLSGDFDAEVARTHQGSEAGDTEESFHAIRVGRDYFTRGSGGPFVRWDDARNEPDAAADSVLQGSRDLLSVAAKCGRVTGDGTTRVLSLASPGCAVSSPPGGAPFSAVVTRLDGEDRRESGRPVSLRLSLALDLESGGHRATVTVEHSLAFSDRSPGEAVEAPRDAVPAGRERPVVMARSVLGGLVDAWGPGAPDVLRKPAPPRARTGEKASEEEH